VVGVPWPAAAAEAVRRALAREATG
jgi:hypothetical protein